MFMGGVTSTSWGGEKQSCKRDIKHNSLQIQEHWSLKWSGAKFAKWARLGGGEAGDAIARDARDATAQCADSEV